MLGSVSVLHPAAALVPALLCALPMAASGGAAPPPFPAPSHPVTSDAVAHAPGERARTEPPAPLTIRGYRLLSGFSRGRCPHHPSCSAYAAEAMHRLGPVEGSFAAVDRLLRGDRSSALRLLPRGADGLLADPLEAALPFLALAPAPAAAGEEEPAAAPGTVLAPSGLAPVLAVAADAPGGAEQAVRFGDWLAARGDLYRAIGEWQRALYLAPDAPGAEAVELRIARAYGAGGQPEPAAELLRRLEVHGRTAAIRDEARFERGRLRLAAGDAPAAAAALEAYLRVPEPEGGAGPSPARLLLGLARLRLGDAGGARAAAAEIPAADPLAREAAAFVQSVAAFESAPRKSPLAAGLLSAAVPGLGHFYTGAPAAGVTALAVNALFVWGTVEAFQDGRPALGALLAVGEVIWYGGAIFGSVAEAHRFTRDARAAALAGAEGGLRWLVLPAPGGISVGVGGPLGRVDAR